MNRGLNSLALITGGSAGIGFQFAKLLADDGYDLIITGSSNQVDSAEQELQTPDCTVTAVQSDLSQSAGVQQVIDAFQAIGRPLDVLILNAGIALGGGFLELDLEKHLKLVDLNITSTVRLCHALLPDVIAAKGKVLMVSSLSATTPTPFESIYGPTKAFITSFGHGLREELRDTGVTVTLLHPGATATSFHERAGMGETAFGDNSWKNDPALVARQGFDAMKAGVTSLIGGDQATLRVGHEHKTLSEEEKARRHAKMARPRQQKEIALL